MHMLPPMIARGGGSIVYTSPAAANAGGPACAPDDLAAMGALLLSDDGSYIAGQVISIDGGTTVRP